MNFMSLKILVDAMEAIKMLRDVSDDKLTTTQFMQALRADSALSAYVNEILEDTKVEVTE